MASDLGTGTTITFATSGFTAELLNVDGPDGSRVSVETSHMGTTTSHTFTPGDLVDWGEVSIEFAFLGSETPPMNQAAETVTIDWGGSGNTWAFSAFMTGYKPGAALEERMTASATLKVTGGIT